MLVTRISLSLSEYKSISSPGLPILLRTSLFPQDLHSSSKKTLHPPTHPGQGKTIIAPGALLLLTHDNASIFLMPGCIYTPKFYMSFQTRGSHASLCTPIRVREILRHTDVQWSCAGAQASSCSNTPQVLLTCSQKVHTSSWCLEALSLL